jgi:hypothetical protein
LLRNLAKNIIKNVLYIRNLAFLRTLDKAVKGFPVDLSEASLTKKTLTTNVKVLNLFSLLPIVALVTGKT